MTEQLVRRSILSLNADGKFGELSDLSDFLSGLHLHQIDDWAVIVIQELDKTCSTKDENEHILRVISDTDSHLIARFYPGTGSYAHAVVVHRSVAHRVKQIRWSGRSSLTELLAIGSTESGSTNGSITSILACHTPHDNQEAFYAEASALLRCRSLLSDLWCVGDFNADPADSDKEVAGTVCFCICA